MRGPSVLGLAGAPPRPPPSPTKRIQERIAATARCCVERLLPRPRGPGGAATSSGGGRAGIPPCRRTGATGGGPRRIPAVWGPWPRSASRGGIGRFCLQPCRSKGSAPSVLREAVEHASTCRRTCSRRGPEAPALSFLMRPSRSSRSGNALALCRAHRVLLDDRIGRLARERFTRRAGRSGTRWL